MGKDTIVLFDSSYGTLETIENCASAVQALFARLSGEVYVVCEATGGFEANLLTAAHEAGCSVHRADPRKAKAFARSLRSYGKTDALDAEALAAYGLERHEKLPLWKPRPQAVEDLQKLVRLRTDLVHCRADYKRRFKAPGQGPDKQHITALIEDLSHRIKQVEADIDDCLGREARIKRMVDVIEAVPGCGHVTAFTLAGLMPELGLISNRQAASLAGLAPHPNDSGKATGYRSTKGGRNPVKAFMFLTIMAARQHNPRIREKYEHLIAKGKKPMVALIACARKLITIINAKIRDALYKPKQKLS